MEEGKKLSVIWEHRRKEIVLTGTPEEIVDEMRKSGLVVEERIDYKEGVAGRVKELYDEFIPTHSCSEFLEALVRAGLISVVH